MERPDNSLSTLQDIRNIMNRSSLFLSLSGWSGIAAGAICLLASFIAGTWINSSKALEPLGEVPMDLVQGLLILATITFLLAFATVYLITRRQVSRENKGIWEPGARKLLAALFIPIFVGAFFIFGLIANHTPELSVPASLVFYGLGLISASKYTFTDIKYLGLLNIVLGLIAMYFPDYGLYFWAAGFGLAHITYGLLMFKRNAQ